MDGWLNLCVQIPSRRHTGFVLCICKEHNWYQKVWYRVQQGLFCPEYSGNPSVLLKQRKGLWLSEEQGSGDELLGRTEVKGRLLWARHTHSRSLHSAGKSRPPGPWVWKHSPLPKECCLRLSFPDALRVGDAEARREGSPEQGAAHWRQQHLRAINLAWKACLQGDRPPTWLGPMQTLGCFHSLSL